MATYEDDGGRSMRGTLAHVQNKFKKKESAVAQADEKLQKLCDKAEANLRELEGVKSKKYELESNLKSIEYRLREHSKTEKDCESELTRAQKNVERIQKLIKREEDFQKEEEKRFEEEVHILSGKFFNGREIFHDDSLELEITKLCETNHVIAQELLSIKTDLKELSLKLDFQPSSCTEFLISNCQENRLKVKNETAAVKEKTKILKEKGQLIDKNRASLEKEIMDLKIKHNLI